MSPEKIAVLTHRVSELEISLEDLTKRFNAKEKADDALVNRGVGIGLAVTALGALGGYILAAAGKLGLIWH